MSEKRKIDDADLTEIAGAGELVTSKEERLPRVKPVIPAPPGDGVEPPETDDQNNGNQEFGT